MEVQAEALGYADWAEIIDEAIDRLLADSGRSESCADLRSALDQRREGFGRADRLLRLLRDRLWEVEDEDDPIAAFAELLDLPGREDLDED